MKLCRGAKATIFQEAAWGNHKVLDASGAEITESTHIGHLNGFRYRGYYYSTELGLYYLKSRFYDPVVGRFINADSVEYLDPSSVNGLNLYAYCGNNPVMCVDPNGNLAFFVISAIVGAVIGFGITLYSDYADDGKIFNGSVGAWSYIGNALAGGAIGAFAGAFASAVTTSTFFSTASSIWNGIKTIYSFGKIAGGAGALYMMADNLKNAIYYTPHVFWSGDTVAKDAATKYALDNGYITVGMTRVGQYLETGNYAQKAWEIASYNFANQVPDNSTIHAILYYPKMWENSIWYTQELGVLINKMVEIIVGR